MDRISSAEPLFPARFIKYGHRSCFSGVEIVDGAKERTGTPNLVPISPTSADSSHDRSPMIASTFISSSKRVAVCIISVVNRETAATSSRASVEVLDSYFNGGLLFSASTTTHINDRPDPHRRRTSSVNSAADEQKHGDAGSELDGEQ
ncbi:hypothetical protein LINGRAPRIM_LOCUS1406 [Linum grandiflorum]